MASKATKLMALGIVLIAMLIVPRKPKSGAPQAQPSTAVEAVGYFEPETQTRELFFVENGIVAKVLVQEGQSVRKGDLLAALENQQYCASLAIAVQEEALAKAEELKVLSGASPEEINVARAAQNLAAEKMAQAKREFLRINELFAETVASKTEFDLAESTLKQSEHALAEAKFGVDRLERIVRPEDKSLARSKVLAASARVEFEKRRIADTELRAPVDGTVLSVVKYPGESARLLDPQPVLVFGNLSAMRVRAEVDERFAARIHAGQSVLIYGYNLGKITYKGRVERVKQIMGKKTVFTRNPTEHKDLETVDVYTSGIGSLDVPIGLRVDVRIFTGYSDRNDSR